MCSYDDDYPDFWSDGVRRARKEHSCGGCLRKIEPGETYNYASCLMDGAFSTYKVCEHCFAAGQWIVKVCHYHPWTNLDVELEEHYREGFNSLSMGRLIHLRTRKWRRKGTLMTVDEVKAVVDDALAHTPELALAHA